MASAPFKQLKIFFQSLDAAGHLGACFGIAQVLVKRGHEVTFFLAPNFKGQAEAFGCKEIIYDTKPTDNEAPTSTKNPIKDAATELLSSGMLGPKSSFEKLAFLTDGNFIEKTLNKLIKQSGQIEKEIKEKKPDLFILDYFLVLPVIQQNVPFVSIFSGCPLFLYKSPKLPPGCSGYATNSDPTTWKEFANIFTNDYVPFFGKAQAKLNAHFNFKPVKSLTYSDLQQFNASPYLNLYGYPKELDYQEIVPMPSTFLQVDAFCRQETKEFTIPKELAEMPGKALIYFSMGSMGGIDVDLMKRLLAILAKAPYKFIVSKGPRHAEIELPPNCWGEEYLPQTAILPLVDLVITHGGNNSFTETFSFGKKMIVLPLFVDQYDNATRIVEKGYGASINPYDFEENQLLEAIDRLLADKELAQKLANVAERIKRDNSKTRACEAIEKLVQKVS